jgi:hypothetical protein
MAQPTMAQLEALAHASAPDRYADIAPVYSAQGDRDHSNNLGLQTEYPIRDGDENMVAVAQGWRSFADVVAGLPRFTHDWHDEEAYELEQLRQIAGSAAMGLNDDAMMRMDALIQRKWHDSPRLGFAGQWVTRLSVLEAVDDLAFENANLQGRHRYLVGRTKDASGVWRYFFVTADVKAKFQSEGKWNYADASGRIDETGRAVPLFLVQPPETTWEQFKDWFAGAGGLLSMAKAFMALADGDLTAFFSFSTAVASVEGNYHDAQDSHESDAAASAFRTTIGDWKLLAGQLAPSTGQLAPGQSQTFATTQPAGSGVGLGLLALLGLALGWLLLD